MTGRLPMTIWTASASPAARIMPRITAVSEARLGGRQQDVADGLPARRAERQRARAHLPRDRDNES